MGNVEPIRVSEEGFETEFRAKIDRPPLVFDMGIPLGVYSHDPMADRSAGQLAWRGRGSIVLRHY
jgi:hypothetical protein